MQGIRFGCHGTNGHQIIGVLPRLTGATLAAVSEISDEALANLARQVPEIKEVPRYATLEEMLADPNVDAVSLCSARRDQQSRQTLAAVRAGKHVLAEKPLATSLEQLDELEQGLAGARVHVVAMLGMSYLPIVRRLREIVRSGRLGTIVQVYAMKSYPYHESRPQDRGIDGGLICQAGIHAVDFIRFVTGLEVEEVFAWDTSTGNPKPGRLQMGATTALRFQGGAVGCLLTNYCNPRSLGFWGNDQLRVHGTQGMVEAVDGFTRARFAPVEGTVEELPVEPPDYHAQTQDFVHFLRGQGPMQHTLQDSLRATRIVLAAQASADKGRPVRV